MSAWPPDRTGSEQPSDRGDVVALALVFAVALIIVGALIAGLSFDAGDGEGNGDTWKLRLKIISMSNLSFGPFISLASTPLAIAVALLIAVRMSPRPPVAPAVAVLAGYLAVVTALGLWVDVTLFDEDGLEAGPVIGTLLGDLGSLVAFIVALWWGATASREY